MPSIWITSKSRPERSDAIHSCMRAADSATKRRETADFERPAPADAGTSPPGNRTDLAYLRVATLINIWFMDHLPSQSSATAASQLGTASSLSLIHISEPTRRTPISYAVFCLKKKK